MKPSIVLPLACFIGSSFIVNPILAQVTSDNTTSTQVNINDNVAEITGGQTRGTNLFHSFQDFSVSTGDRASFENANSIDNIFSRVTGGNISNIDGIIEANGSANLFLINPNGILFGENARIDIGGSFYGSSASSILFEDGEFSAADLENPPLLTINAPIGLGFREEPGDIVNQSIATDETGEILLGLSVLEDRTLALLGGDVLIEGGILSSEGGRIELGSVGENNTVSLTPIEQGFDLSYEDVESFQDIALSAEAFVATSGSSTADIDIQGQNVSITENSQVGINPNFEGQAGDININATESLTLDADGSTEVIFSKISGDATVETSSINVDTSQVTISGGAQIGATSDSGDVRGIDININTSDITLENSRLSGGFPAIGTSVYEFSTGDGGDITISTDTLKLNDGAQIANNTFGPGNGGDITINATESIELNGTIPDEENNQASSILATVGIPYYSISTAGNGGDITITSPRLIARDGAQISTSAQNNGNGGDLTINASESILLSDTSPSPTLQLGRSGIFVNAERAFEDPETGEVIPTTGNGGTLNLNTEQFILEEGAIISANTFSEGQGGVVNINVDNLIVRNGGEIGAGSLIGADSIDAEAENSQRGMGGVLDINATESIEVLGSSEIDGQSVNSSIFTLAQSNGDAGNLSLTTSDLSLSNGGKIDASAIASGEAGSLDINAGTIDLTQGEITASTTSGNGGNIALDIAENLTLDDNSLISARAFENASGGNLEIDSQFVIAFPSQTSADGNDIIANAEQGNGGNITITAESLFGIQERNAIAGNGTNDIDASSARGAEFNGTVTINTPDTDTLQGDRDLPNNLIQTDSVNAQACRGDRESVAKNGFNITGKGGIVPEPGLPLNSLNVLANGESSSASAIPAPIETSQGKIQPARGVKVTESGEIILTAYRTNNAGERIHETRNCGQV